MTQSDVFDVSEEFFGLAKGQNIDTHVNPLKDLFGRYKKRLFNLVVIGEIKKGKSSFINALLGEPTLLPVDVPVTTSTVYKIRYGETEKYEVFFNPTLDSESSPEPLEITPAQLKEYGTEDGNPDNEKEVDYISIHLPNPFLESGVVVTDTPGIGGLFAAHGDITLKNAPMADAVCLVLDSVEAVASRDEMELLKKFLELPTKARGVPPALFCVQTKIDAVSEEVWKDYRTRNLEIISGHLEVESATLNYFPVSAELKHAADSSEDETLLQASGFPQLRNFFEDTLVQDIREREGRIFLSAASQVTEDILIPAFTAQKNDLAADGDKRLAQLQEEANQIKNWSKSDFDQILQKFDDTTTDLHLDIERRIQNELDFSKVSPIVQPILAELKASRLSGRALIKHADTHQAACAEKCQTIVSDIFEQYQTEVTGLITEIADELGTSLKDALSDPRHSRIDMPVSDIEPTISRFAMAREIMYAQVIGTVAITPLSGALMIAAGALSSPGVFSAGMVLPMFMIPLTPVFIFFAWRDMRKRSQTAALQQIEEALCTGIREMQKRTIQDFKVTSTEFKRGFRDFFTSARDEMLASIAERQKSIQEQRRQTIQETQKSATVVSTKVKQAQSLLARMQQMLGSDA